MHMLSWLSSLIVVGWLSVAEASLGLASLTPSYGDAWFSEIAKRGDSSDSKTRTGSEGLRRSISASPAPVSNVARGRSEAVDGPTPTPTPSSEKKERRRKIFREASKKRRIRHLEQLRAGDPAAIKRQEDKRRNDRNWARRNRTFKGVRGPYKTLWRSRDASSERKKQDENREEQNDLPSVKKELVPSAGSPTRQRGSMSVSSGILQNNNRQKKSVTAIPQHAPKAQPINQARQGGSRQHSSGTRAAHSSQARSDQMIPTINNSPTGSASLWSIVKKISEEQPEVTSAKTGRNRRQRNLPNSPRRDIFVDSGSTVGMHQNFGPHGMWPQAALPDPNQHINRMPFMPSIPLIDQQAPQPPGSDAARMIQIFREFQRD